MVAAQNWPESAFENHRRLSHIIYQGDARVLSQIADASVHLVVTSPPYWTLKEYPDHPAQLGAIADYERFLAGLDRVWSECFRILVPGGRLVCAISDICLARRKNRGRHIEYILMLRKLGGDRKPTEEQRRLSHFSREEHAA